jgi:hypothetical protein
MFLTAPEPGVYEQPISGYPQIVRIYTNVERARGGSCRENLCVITNSDKQNGGFAVRVPKRHQGIPAGVAPLASSREPTSLDAIERAAIQAVRDDPWRRWEWVGFGPTPLPTSNISRPTSIDAQRGPTATVEQPVYLPSWRPCRPERVKGDGRVLPPERPTTFRTEAEAQATLDRYHRLGAEAGVPLSGHLSYGVVAPIEEWEATAGQPTADREREQIQAEVEVATLEAKALEGAEALERARERAAANKQRTTVSGDWAGFGVPNVQKRVTADGVEWFRGRVSGKTSETFATEAEATAWVEQQKALA